MSRKKLLKIALLLLTVSTLIGLIVPKNSEVKHLDGTISELSNHEIIITFLRVQFISIPLFSLILALIIAIFVYRNKPYFKRYLNAFLISLSILYGLFAFLGVMKLLRILLEAIF